MKYKIQNTIANIGNNDYLVRILNRFMANRLAVAGLVLFLVYVFIGLVAPYILPHDPNAIDSANRFASPSFEHPFGTDRLGRDVLSRVIMGARFSLKIGIIVVIATSIPGTMLGLIAGYYRGKTDELIMRLADISFAFPSLLLGLLVISI
jgi:ABC-type dipeptide/oligopeptide/nickel transport system permease subunit